MRMVKIMKIRLWNISFPICLLGFTLYVLLDTFVITRVYRENTTEINTSYIQSYVPSGTEITEEAPAENVNVSSVSVPAVENNGSGQSVNSFTKPAAGAKGTHRKKRADTTNTSSGEKAAETASLPESGSDNYYEDEQIKISLQTYEVSDTVVYVADIRLSSVENLKTAFAYDMYGRNVTAKTSEIASEHNAILAINGDYYGAQERGYVIRNGIVYRDIPGNSEVLCINTDGSLSIVMPGTVTAGELLEQGVWQAFSFGPALVREGEIAVDENTEVGRAKASNPRTAIGVIDDLHYIFVVSDGRTTESEGLSLYELADFMRQLGAETAYNLDGGGSSTMVFKGNVINNPTTSGSSIKERSISDIIYIG